MKGTKTQKGITLVALIITIVVLLILAVVAINSILNTDLIAHAENAAKTYNNSVKNEADILGGYLNYLEEATRCKHYYGNDIYCDYCEAICPHTWDSNGTSCTTCPFTCEHEYEYGNGICVKENCGYGCPHESTVEDPAHDSLGAEGHISYIYCNVCWELLYDETEGHYFYEGVCQRCWYECEHPNATYTYEGKSANDLLNYGDHAVLVTCYDCGYYNTFVEAEKCTYENGLCTKCKDSCIHPYGFYGGSCEFCGAECQHTNLGEDAAWYMNDKYTHYIDEICHDCYYYTGNTYTYSHDFWDGYCRCGYQCEHENVQYTYEGKSANDLLNYGDHAVLGTCPDCDLYNSFVSSEKCTYENGLCTKCKDSCTHPYGFNGGSCEFCGAECQHTNLGEDAGYAYYDENNHYTNEICYDCYYYTGNTYTYPHYFYDGYCQCGYQCEHDMNNGTCSKCGYECSHDWSNYNGVCKICGIECNHEFSYGSCATCGADCPHASTTWGDPYSMGDNMHESVETCNDCGSTINGVGYDHDYINSYCSTCGHTCQHGWDGDAIVGGKCSYCDYGCLHDWSNLDGICTKCKIICTECEDMQPNGEFPIICYSCGKTI